MNKPIVEGCWAEIRGSGIQADGEIVQVLFADAPANGHPVWVISEEFVNGAGFLTDRCYESFLHRIEHDPMDDIVRELVTTWEEVEYSTNWKRPSAIEAS